MRTDAMGGILKTKHGFLVAQSNFYSHFSLSCDAMRCDEKEKEDEEVMYVRMENLVNFRVG